MSMAFYYHVINIKITIFIMIYDTSVVVYI